MCIDWVDIEDILKSKIFSYRKNNLIGHTLTRMFTYIVCNLFDRENKVLLYLEKIVIPVYGHKLNVNFLKNLR